MHYHVARRFGRGSVAVLTVVFLVYVGSLVFVRMRNRVHLPFARQLTDFSTFTVPLNLPAYLFSRVSTKSRMPPAAQAAAGQLGNHP